MAGRPAHDVCGSHGIWLACDFPATTQEYEASWQAQDFWSSHPVRVFGCCFKFPFIHRCRNYSGIKRAMRPDRIVLFEPYSQAGFHLIALSGFPRSPLQLYDLRHAGERLC